MRFNILLLTLILSATMFFVGCGTTETPSNANSKPANTNTNTASVNSNDPFATNKKPEAATSNNAPTLAPIVNNYYDALKKKDEAGVKKYLSQAALKYWQDEMKSEKKNSLVAILEDNESPVEDKREVRNETVQGDTAFAEMKGGSLGVWTKVKFVKENGEWKFASPAESPELEGVPKPAANAV